MSMQRQVALTADWRELHTLCMKRTTLMVNEELLEEAVRLGGERTYSKTVNRALEELVRRIKARQILNLGGSGLWQGDLSEMRRDAVPSAVREP